MEEDQGLQDFPVFTPVPGALPSAFEERRLQYDSEHKLAQEALNRVLEELQLKVEMLSGDVKHVRKRIISSEVNNSRQAERIEYNYKQIEQLLEQSRLQDQKLEQQAQKLEKYAVEIEKLKEQNALPFGLDPLPVTHVTSSSSSSSSLLHSLVYQPEESFELKEQLPAITLEPRETQSQQPRPSQPFQPSQQSQPALAIEHKPLLPAACPFQMNRGAHGIIAALPLVALALGAFIYQQALNTTRGLTVALPTFVQGKACLAFWITGIKTVFDHMFIVDRSNPWDSPIKLKDFVHPALKEMEIQYSPIEGQDLLSKMAFFGKKRGPPVKTAGVENRKTKRVTEGIPKHESGYAYCIAIPLSESEILVRYMQRVKSERGVCPYECRELVPDNFRNPKDIRYILKNKLDVKSQPVIAGMPLPRDTLRDKARCLWMTTADFVPSETKLAYLREPCHIGRDCKVDPRARVAGMADTAALCLKIEVATIETLTLADIVEPAVRRTSRKTGAKKQKGFDDDFFEEGIQPQPVSKRRGRGSVYDVTLQRDDLNFRSPKHAREDEEF